MSDKINNEADFILQNLMEQGIINSSDIQSIKDMNKKTKVLKVHDYEVSQGKGKDKRWFTYVPDETKKDGRRKVGKQTETELYNLLYDFYFENDEELYKSICLQEIYKEWLWYKNTLARRSNYIKRIDDDYKKFCANEPLSALILTKPLTSLTKVDIETWAYNIIKKYKLTAKAYYNMSIVLRQVLDYLVDKEIMESNVFRRVKIKSMFFKKSRKKKAETQVFFPDEISMIVEQAYFMAEQTADENYLAIPLFFRSGIRIGECLGLRFSDFDRDNNLIISQQSLVVEETLNEDGTWGKKRYELIDNLKGGVEERQILVGDECFDIVDKVRDIHKAKGITRDLLFVVKTPSNIQLKLYSLCKQVGIRERSPHKTRKTYISTLLNNGVDADFVREQVGHRDLKTTLDSYTYSTTRKEHQLEQLNRLLA